MTALAQEAPVTMPEITPPEDTPPGPAVPRQTVECVRRYQ